MRYVDLLTELSYQSYKANRDRAPHIAAERWAEVYPESASVFEARYQLEKKHAASRPPHNRRRTDGGNGES